MNCRHEWKHEINLSDLTAIRQRLRAVARPDLHAVDGRYTIRSLYFDGPADRALREKLGGVNRREKFRIRYYNGDPSLIHLENTGGTIDITAAQDGVHASDSVKFANAGLTVCARNDGITASNGDETSYIYVESGSISIPSCCEGL